MYGMDGFLHFLVIHESTQRIRVFLIGKCQCSLSGRRLYFFKRRIAILVNKVCDNGNVGIIARSRYNRQAIYQSGQPVSQGFELPAEFLPDDPVYHVNIFGGGFGRRAGKPRAQRGEDLKVDVEVSLEEAFSGKEEEVSYTRLDTCSVCHGTGAQEGSARKTCRSCGGSGTVTYSQGFLSMRQTCPDCNGTGTVIEKPCLKCHGSGAERVKETLTVKIPSGVRTGITLRVANGGNIGVNGGGFGDLYVEVRVKEHKIFRREGDDLLIDASISYPQAVLGGSIKVPTIEGKELEVTIPKGTQSGQVLKMQGNGMPRLGKKGFGDLLVNVKIEVIKKPTARQKELLEALAKETGGKKSFFQELFS